MPHFGYLCKHKEVDKHDHNQTCFKVAWYSSRTIIVDVRHRFTVKNMNNTPVPIGQMHSFLSYV